MAFISHLQNLQNAFELSLTTGTIQFFTCSSCNHSCLNFWSYRFVCLTFSEWSVGGIRGFKISKYVWILPQISTSAYRKYENKDFLPHLDKIYSLRCHGKHFSLDYCNLSTEYGLCWRFKRFYLRSRITHAKHKLNMSNNIVNIV